jgi:methyl-accepting chemotaxis protein
MKAVFAGIGARLWALIGIAVLGASAAALYSLDARRESMLEEKRQATRHVVEVAHGVVAGYHKLAASGALRDEEARKLAAAALKSLRYEGQEYFWITDTAPRMIMHPLKPELEGKNLAETTDGRGVRHFAQMANLVKRDKQGYVSYWQIKPGIAEPVAKISYVKGFEPWDWIIASGIYVADVDAAMLASARTLAAAFAGGILLLCVLGALIARSVTRPLNTAIAFADAIAAGKLDNRMAAGGRGETGRLFAALDTMQKNLLERSEVDRKALAENLRIRIALDNASTNIRIADSDGRIVYLNRAIEGTIRKYEDAIRRELPGFEAAKLLGGSVGVFYPDPAAALKTLATLESTRRSRLTIGGRQFDIVTNPITSATGERLGSVGEWVDRTEDLKAEGEISALIERARHGNFDAAIDARALSGFHAQAATGLNDFQREVRDGLEGVRRVLERLADGDLTARMDGQYEGAFDAIKENCNATCERLNAIVGQIRQGAETINTAARELAMGNTDLSQRTEEQAASLQQTAASMGQLSATVRQNSESAAKANELAITASETAFRGGGVVGQVVGTMETITASSKKIVDIISVIDGIAFQTNILALNAAVEAARAGEQGRGFAVVATEVRNLAQKSANAAREIKGLIGDSVQKVEAGSRLVADAGRNMDEIVSSVKRVTDIMGEITSASQQQGSGIEQVNNAVAQMDKVTQQNAALVEQAAASAQSMEEQALGLSRTVSVFRVAESIEPPRPAQRPRTGKLPAGATGATTCA